MYRQPVTPAPTRPGLSRENTVLAVLCAIQATHVMDFMVMMPLGPQLMRAFSIGPDRFGLLVSSYGISAAVSGLLAAFLLDRIDRRRALLWLYAGFGLATLACALAPGYWSLLAARIAAGGFGGVAGSVVTAIVADLVPGERRGAAMGKVMSAFPIASILGVPAGLLLSNLFGWHAPFFVIAALALPVLLLARSCLPSLPPVGVAAADSPLRQVISIVVHRVHLRAFLTCWFLVFTGSSVIPFMAPAMVANGGLSEQKLALIYLFGGTATFAATPWLGRLSDRVDKFRLLAGVSVAASVAVFLVTRVGPLPMPVLLVLSTAFMVCVSSRFTPAMAMITNRIEARFRGGFMSLNSSVQQLAAGVGALAAGRLISADPSTGRLVGYENAGWVSIGSAVATLAAAWALSRSTPELHHAGEGEKRAAAALGESAEGA